MQSVANRHKMIMILHKTEQKSFFFAKNMYLCGSFPDAYEKRSGDALQGIAFPTYFDEGKQC